MKLTSAGKGVLFTQVSYQLSKLIQDIEIGESGLIDIQRPFVWTSTKSGIFLIRCTRAFLLDTYDFGQMNLPLAIVI
jgi:hypothetical protein